MLKSFLINNIKETILKGIVTWFEMGQQAMKLNRSICHVEKKSLNTFWFLCQLLAFQFQFNLQLVHFVCLLLIFLRICIWTLASIFNSLSTWQGKRSRRNLKNPDLDWCFFKLIYTVQFCHSIQPYNTF